MYKLIENTRRCDISFHRSGAVSISARIAKILRLKRDDVINIGYERGEYYLFVDGRAGEIVGRREGRVYPSHWGMHMRTNSVRLCGIMLGVTGCAKMARLVCGDPVQIDGRTMVPIITKFNLNQSPDE